MTSSPQPLPSLPPSPSSVQAPKPLPAPRQHEDDIAQAWHEDEPTIIDGQHLNPRSKRRKSRKGKERAGSESDEDDEDEDEEEESAAAAGYPPTKEEEAESRRVEEVRTSSTLSRCLICAPASPTWPLGLHALRSWL